MDVDKRKALLEWITASWDHPVDEIIDLRNGLFFQFVLEQLHHWNKEGIIISSDEERLQVVFNLLHDNYGNVSDVQGIMDMDKILSNENLQVAEMELAKVAVFLMAHGVLASSHFMEATLGLPLSYHVAIKTLVTPVVQPNDSPLSEQLEDVLTSISVEPQTEISTGLMISWIEKRKPSLSLESNGEEMCRAISPIKAEECPGEASSAEHECHDPAESILASAADVNIAGASHSRDGKTSPPISGIQHKKFMEPALRSTPKDMKHRGHRYSMSAACYKDSPVFKSNSSIHNYSLRDITSPLRGLNLSTSSPQSPLSALIQSPQLVQKAELQKKELEIRRLHKELSTQVLLNDDKQLTINDHIAALAQKDKEIDQLKSKIAELREIKDKVDVMEETQTKYEEMAGSYNKLKNQVITLNDYKSQCHILEKENASQRDDMQKLHTEIKELEIECNKNKDVVRILHKKENEMAAVEAQLEMMISLKEELEEKLTSVQLSLSSTKENCDHLKQELEEAQAVRNDGAQQGESMGIIVDMQLADIKNELTETHQEKESLLKQLEEANVLAKSKEAHVQEIKDLMGKMEKELETSRMLIQEKEEKIRQLGLELEERLEDLNHQIKKRDEQCEEKENIIVDQSAKIQEFQAAQEQAQLELSSEAEEKSQLKGKLVEFEKEIASLNTLLTSKEDNIFQIQSGKESLERNLAEYLESNRIMNEDIVKKDDVIADLKSELTQSTSSCQDLALQISQRDTANSQLQTQLLEMKASSEVLEKKCVEMDTCLTDREKKISDLVKENCNLNEELKDTNSELMKCNNTMEAQKADLDANALRLSDVEMWLAQREEELNTVISEKKSIKADYDKKCSELSNLAEKVDQNGKQSSQLITELNAQVDDIKSELSVKTEECFNLRQELVEKEQKIEKSEEQCSELQRKLADESKKLSDMAFEKDQIKQDLADKIDKVSELALETEKKCQDLEQMRNEQTELQKKLSQISEELAHTCSERDSLSRYLKSKCEEVSLLVEDVNNKKQELEKTTSNLAEVKETLNNRCGELSQAERECHTMRVEMVAKGEEISSLSSSLESKSKTLDKKEETLVHLEDKLSQLNAKFSLVTAEKEQLNEKQVHFEKEISSKDAEIDHLSCIVKEKETALSQIESKLLASEAICNELEQQLKKSVEESAERGNYADDLRDRFDLQVNEVKSNAEKISHLSAELSLVNSEKEEALSKVSQMEEALKDKDIEVKKVTEALAEKDSALSEADINFTSLKEVYNEIQESFKKSQEEISEKDCYANDLLQRYGLLEADFKKCEQELQQIKSDRDVMSKTNAEVDLELQDKISELSSINAEKADLELKISSLTETNNTLKEELKRTMDANVEKDNAFDDLQQRYNNLLSDLKKKENELEEQQKEVEGRINEVSEKSTAVSGLESRLLAFTAENNCLLSELEEVKSEKLQVQKERDEVLANVEELSTTLATRERTIQSMNERFQEAEANHGQMEETSKQHFNHLEMQLKDSEEKVQSLKNESTSLLSEKKSLQDKLDTNLKIFEHEKEVLNDKISSLNADLNEANSKSGLLHQEFETRECVIKSVTESNEQLQLQLKLKEEELSTMSEWETKYNDVLSDLAAKEEAITEKDSVVQSLQAINDQLSKDRQQTEDKLQQKINSLELELGEMIKALDKKNSGLGEIEESIKSLKESHETIVKEHEEKEKELTAEICSLSATLSQRDDELQKRDMTDQTLKNTLEQITASLQQKEELIKKLEASLGEEQSSAHLKNKAISEKEAEILSIQSQFDAASACLKEKEAALIAKESLVASLQTEYAEVQTKYQAEMDGMLDKLKVTFEAAKAEELKALAEQKVKFEEEIASLHKEHEAAMSTKERCYEENVAQLLEKLASAEKQILEERRTFEGVKSTLEQEVSLTKEATRSTELELENVRMNYDKTAAMYQESLSESNARHQQLQLNCTESASDAQRLKVQVSQLEKKCKAVQSENQQLMERENRLLKDNESHMRKANEMNDLLRSKLEAAIKKLENSEKEKDGLMERSKNQDQHNAMMKENNTRLSNALSIERATVKKMQERMESYATKHDNMKTELENANKENKIQIAEVTRLKTALDYSDRKLREYNHQLETAGTALLGDPSHFESITGEKVSRNSTDSDLHNETILSADSVMLKRETIANGPNLRSRVRLPDDRLSVCSTASTTSATSIKSLAGVHPAILPSALSCCNEPDDGPNWNILNDMQRVNELKRRNTLCLPHMKSSYPVETQAVKKDKVSDDALRLSLMPEQMSSSPESKSNSGKSGKKRKAEKAYHTQDVEMESPKQMKEDETSPGGTIIYFPLARNGPVYQKAGPPTPAKPPRRVSSRFTPIQATPPQRSVKTRVLGSPIARGKHQTPRRSPRFNAKKKSPAAVVISEAAKHRESVAFDVGFTPKKDAGQKKWRGLLRKDSKATGKQEQKAAEKKRKPLATRNFKETGL